MSKATIPLRAQFSVDNKLANDRPARPLARYPGSKNRTAAWIISYFPAVHDTFIVPYGGMAATLFAKTRSGIEVYNDLNDDVVHLFRTIREHHEELIQAINWTAWSPSELALATEPTDDPIERARRFYSRLWMSFQPFDRTVHFRRQMKYSRGRDGNNSMISAAKLFADTDSLYDVAGRLRGVVIENMDALHLIQKYDYDRALFYCDPPYVHDTRIRTKHYSEEMTDPAHRFLADALDNISGMAIISGYACDLYTELYENNGWQRVDRMARTNGRDKVESVWLSPNTVDALAEESDGPKQQSLFDLF